jgi:hypothetical protein
MRFIQFIITSEDKKAQESAEKEMGTSEYHEWRFVILGFLVSLLLCTCNIVKSRRGLLIQIFARLQI